MQNSIYQGTFPTLQNDTYQETNVQKEIFTPKLSISKNILEKQKLIKSTSLSTNILPQKFKPQKFKSNQTFTDGLGIETDQPNLITLKDKFGNAPFVQDEKEIQWYDHDKCKSCLIYNTFYLLCKYYIPDKNDRLILMERLKSNYYVFHPPVFILLIIIFEIIIFTKFEKYCSNLQNVNRKARISTMQMEYFQNCLKSSKFILNLYCKKEIWRYISYIFLHINKLHLLTNVLIQFIIYFPLEIIYGSSKILMLFLFSTLFGSSIASILSYKSHLVGASASVTAVQVAYLLYYTKFWITNKIDLNLFNIWIILVNFIGLMYSYYKTSQIDPEYYNNTSFWINFGGMLCGSSIGLVILNSFNKGIFDKKRLFHRASMLNFSIILTILVILLTTLLAIFFPNFEQSKFCTFLN